MTLRAQRGLVSPVTAEPSGQVNPSEKSNRHTTACLGRRPLCTLVTQVGPSSNWINPTAWGSPQSYTHQLCPAPPPLDTPHRPKQVTRTQREKSNHSGEIHRAEHPALPLVTSACTLSRQQASAPPSNRRSRTFQGNPQSRTPCSAPVGLRSAHRRQVALQQGSPTPARSQTGSSPAARGPPAHPSSHH